MNITLITLVLSIIGCVTGIASLLIQFFSYIITSARLDIELDKKANSYFFNAKTTETPGYKTNYAAVISLKLSNKSAYPITVDSIYIKDKKQGLTYIHRNDFKFYVPKIYTGEDGSYIERHPSKIIHLPCRIDAFDTIFASIRFPFFEKFIDADDLTKPSNLFIYINTPRKVYKCKVALYELQYFHDHYQEIHTK